MADYCSVLLSVGRVRHTRIVSVLAISCQVAALETWRPDWSRDWSRGLDCNLAWHMTLSCRQCHQLMRRSAMSGMRSASAHRLWDCSARCRAWQRYWQRTSYASCRGWKDAKCRPARVSAVMWTAARQSRCHSTRRVTMSGASRICARRSIRLIREESHSIASLPFLRDIAFLENKMFN